MPRAAPSTAVCCLQPKPHAKPVGFYRPRNHESSAFFKVVRDHFDTFERVYDERFRVKYGFWRPVIRKSIDRFLKCGDRKEGFARVRCPDCREEFFVAFSCRQRSCCPSCDQKRALLLGHRLKNEVFESVPHRQWVFTMPKRLRIYFRFDRNLLGGLCRAAYDTVRDVFKLEVDGGSGTPAMVGAVQTFGDLIHWHSHVHAIVPEGVFAESGVFVHIPYTWRHRAIEIWQDRVFELLLDVGKIDLDVVAGMRDWKHSLQPSRLQPSGRLRRALRTSCASSPGSVSITRCEWMPKIMPVCIGSWNTSPAAPSA